MLRRVVGIVAKSSSSSAAAAASFSPRCYLSTTTSTLDRAKSPEDFDRVLQTFATIRACAVLRTPTSAACPRAMQACIDGGFEIVEFTLTTPDCLHHLADFCARYDKKVMVGCGTIMNVSDVEAAIDAGGEFIITPVMLPDVIQWCAARDIVIAPGCQTPTEMVNAYRHGAPLQKLFPGVTGGPMWVKAVSAALPMLSINPTSGVDLDNAAEYLANGAASVGLVAPLFDPAAIAKGDWDQIAKNAAKVMANVRTVGPYVRK